MNQIIIGFSTPKKRSFLPWLIRKAMKTDFSHVYVKFYSKAIDRTLIYQASGMHVNFIGESAFLQTNKIIAEFSIDVTEEQRTQVLARSVDLVGKFYGIKQLIGMGWVYLCHSFGKRVKNPFSDGSKTYICSEIGGDALVTLGKEIEDLDTLSPKDLYDILRG